MCVVVSLSSNMIILDVKCFVRLTGLLVGMCGQIAVHQGYEHGKCHSKDVHTTTNGRWLTYNGLVEPATKEELSLVWQMCMSAKAVSCADICVWVACMLKFGLENHVVWIVFLICRIPFKRSLALVSLRVKERHKEIRDGHRTQSLTTISLDGC